MPRRTAAHALVERFCRPHRVGLFGHRGVGKTTLLTMLYREAVHGRLPNLRLAAADVATADYLSDKLLHLETDQALPATLAETELRFHLYGGHCRLELLVRDYQGEHVELGRESAIQSYLRDCDAVCLCLDVGSVPEPASRLRRQQEIEKFLEDCLVGESRATLERPVALLLTKADLLPALPADLDELVRERFGMTRHALTAHCPQNGVFAISALGALNLAEPLAWLTQVLQTLDEARLQAIWTLAQGDPALVHHCLACFARRYPEAPVAGQYQRRLHELRWRRRWRQGLVGTAATASLILGLWTYDAAGYQDAQRLARHHSEPSAALQTWQRYCTWHPTRHLTRTLTPAAEAQLFEDLVQRVRERQRNDWLAELRRQAVDPDADPEIAWRRFQDFRAAHPEVNIDGDLENLRTAIKTRRDEQFNQRARRALDELERAVQRSDDLPALVKQVDAFLAEFADSVYAEQGRRYRAALLYRLDERDIQAARDYSARNPLHFQTRREHYQRYLELHPTGGAFTQEAEDALQRIAREWDNHDFRILRDHFRQDPGNVAALTTQGRRYLTVHPQGKYRAAVAELLRWSERVRVPGEYRVVLKNGHFDKSVGRWFSRGPKLSVELEVNGIRYGPSTISYNKYDAEWDFEFPRRIRWKLGDPVVIRVSEHSWGERVLIELASDPRDPLAMRLLSGEVCVDTHRLTFHSDFALPTLPQVE